MRIDAHHHVWDLNRREQPWTAEVLLLRRSFDLDELRPHLLAHRVDATIVVQTRCVPGETPELLELADRDGMVAGVVGWVDLTAVDVADRIDALQQLPGGSSLLGIRHQVQDEPDPAWLARPDVRRGLVAVADAGLVYDVVVRSAQLGSVLEVVRALPGLRFVLDHGGKPPIAAREMSPWGSDMAALGSCPNLAVKLSGLVTEADHQSWQVDDLRPYVEVMLSAFGPGRTVFGSDWPVCLLAADYDSVIAAAESLTADLSETERSDVFGDTAAAWYGIR